MRLPFKLKTGPLDAPQLTPEYVLAAVGTIVGLFVSQGLIDNRFSKIIVGVASVVVPLVLAGISAWARTQAHKAKLTFAAERSWPPPPNPFVPPPPVNPVAPPPGP